MNKSKRIALLKAMDLIVRSCNSENVIDRWLFNGIADGDAESDEELEFYTADDNFAELMFIFLEVMADAREEGGLYCDGVAGGEGTEE